jgi:hypothetical protein
MLTFSNVYCPICHKDLSEKSGNKGWIEGGHLSLSGIGHCFYRACEEHFEQENELKKESINREEGYRGEWTPELGLEYDLHGPFVDGRRTHSYGIIDIPK